MTTMMTTGATTKREEDKDGGMDKERKRWRNQKRKGKTKDNFKILMCTSKFMIILISFLFYLLSFSFQINDKFLIENFLSPLTQFSR